MAAATPAAAETKVLNRKRGHLNEIAEGGFTAIRLPVGVRDEAVRRVKGEIWRDVWRTEVLRIQREMALQSLQQIGEEKAGEAESNQAGGVLRPALAVILAYSGRAIGKNFQPAQHGMKEGAAAIEDCFHEKAHGLGEKQQQAEVHSNQK